MVCRIEDLKKISLILLSAVDSSGVSKITDNLELKVVDSVLYLSVTNGEYFVEAKIPIFDDIKFHATVNAELFLRLISKTTSETVEFIIDNTNLIVDGNGQYKIPLIYDNDKLLELPRINISNVTSTFNIKSHILKSLLQYNSKELDKNIVSNPVQKLYYIDSDGAITFTSGACVNNFKLEKPVKILLTKKVVTLFKLFNSDEIKFTMGVDEINGVFITKVRFDSDELSISAIMPNSSLISSVPVSAIRGRADEDYKYSVTLNRIEIIQVIDRLLLFNDFINRNYGRLEFSPDKVVIYDFNKNNFETVRYSSGKNDSISYSAILDLVDIKTTLDSYRDSHVQFNFGNGQAFTISNPNVCAIIPEVVI